MLYAILTTHTRDNMQAIHICGFKEIVKAAKQQSWVVEITSSGHWKFVPLDKKYSIHICSGTPGKPKIFINRLVRELKQKGLQFDLKRNH